MTNFESNHDPESVDSPVEQGWMPSVNDPESIAEEREMNQMISGFSQEFDSITADIDLKVATDSGHEFAEEISRIISLRHNIELSRMRDRGRLNQDNITALINLDNQLIALTDPIAVYYDLLDQWDTRFMAITDSVLDPTNHVSILTAFDSLVSESRSAVDSSALPDNWKEYARNQFPPYSQEELNDYTLRLSFLQSQLFSIYERGINENSGRFSPNDLRPIWDNITEGSPFSELLEEAVLNFGHRHLGL
jgi:hypothetical protein